MREKKVRCKRKKMRSSWQNKRGKERGCNLSHPNDDGVDEEEVIGREKDSGHLGVDVSRAEGRKLPRSAPSRRRSETLPPPRVQSAPCELPWLRLRLRLAGAWLCFFRSELPLTHSSTTLSALPAPPIARRMRAHVRFCARPPSSSPEPPIPEKSVLFPSRQ